MRATEVRGWLFSTIWYELKTPDGLRGTSQKSTMEVNTMPKYTVNGSVWVSCDFEADSEEEAREMYQESSNDLDQLSSDMHTVFYRDISSVEEE